MAEAAAGSARWHASTSIEPSRGLVIAVGIALLGLASLVFTFVSFEGSPAWGYDFEAYRSAAIRLEQTGSLYQVRTLAGPFNPGPYGLYLYPPPLGISLVPFTDVSLPTGATLWFAIHVVALAFACAVLPVPWSTRLLVFGIAALSFGVVRDFVLGNISVLVLPFLALGWRYLDQPAGSIATAIAIALRPTTGLLLIWQLLRRRWLAAAWTVAAGLVLIAATLPVVGIGGYTEYLTVLRNLSDITGVANNVDLGSTVLGLLGDRGLAEVALLGGYAVAIVAMLASLRRDAEVGFMVTLGASMLLSPLLWDHYFATLVLPAAFLAARGRPLAILLPLLSWLPAAALPLAAIVATIGPFWARERVPEAAAAPEAVPPPLASPA